MQMSFPCIRSNTFRFSVGMSIARKHLIRAKLFFLDQPAGQVLVKSQSQKGTCWSLVIQIQLISLLNLFLLFPCKLLRPLQIISMSWRNQHLWIQRHEFIFEYAIPCLNQVNQGNFMPSIHQDIIPICQLVQQFLTRFYTLSTNSIKKVFHFLIYIGKSTKIFTQLCVYFIVEIILSN